MNTHYEHIDPDIIATNMMHNEQLIVQFISAYIDQSADDLEALRLALNSGDHNEIASKAHHIKPTLSYIGTHDMLSRFQTLEASARNIHPIDDLRQMFAEIDIDFRVILQELKDYLEQKTSERHSVND